MAESTPRAAAPGHAMGYDSRDHEVVDYQVYEFGSDRLPTRGPALDPAASGYVACLGAAQTFGVYCTRPYPTLLAERLGAPALNLGYGGVGPSFFLKHPELIDAANRASVVVVQVMSARSVGNRRYDCDGTDFLTDRATGERISGKAAFDRALDADLGWWKWRGRGRVGAAMASLGLLKTRRMVEENRANYLAEYRELLGRLAPPTVLLWFSKRPPRYEASYEDATKLFNAYPQLVDEPTYVAMKPLADEAVVCVTDRGFPQRLVSRFTGEPVTVRDSDARSDLDAEPMTHNRYYPSPEMHEDAAEALAPVCRRLMAEPAPAAATA